ncbi:DUF2848 domain-containing protein [Halomonas binhaiensis]|uniref:DUF2848 domain-containing protein n=1 Tax=Halomonas binhaiensis TaxID=2562282 RepID=A0A5C1NBL0_9GAMM|nr:DUF2848 domain-containing protein [Halomonas binhaiensis]QEM80341.1 DUF2848 domain-containing protein [Halomonas binhaiensis]
MLTFTHPNGTFSVDIEHVAIAGWAGRDQAGVQHHIDELKALGVKPPSTTPLFYRVSREMLTQQEHVQMLGDAGSGEVETCLVSDEHGRIWVTIASDHTDRALEAVGVAESKQLCAKPVARTAWPLDEVLAHWDQLQLHSEIEENDATVTYQQGTLAELLPVSALIERLPQALRNGQGLAPQSVLLCGTVPAIGGIRPSGRFQMSLIDPVLQRRIDHRYVIETLEVVA